MPYENSSHRIEGSPQCRASASKGMLLRTGTGKVNDPNDKLLWSHAVIQRYGAEVQKVPRVLNASDLLTRAVGESDLEIASEGWVPHSKRVVGASANSLHCWVNQPWCEFRREAWCGLLAKAPLKYAQTRPVLRHHSRYFHWFAPLALPPRSVFGQRCSSMLILHGRRNG